MFASSKVVRRSAANSGVDSSLSNASGQPPSTDELDSVVRVITSELSIACKVNDTNNRLWTAVSKNVAKTVRYNQDRSAEKLDRKHLFSVLVTKITKIFNTNY